MKFKDLKIGTQLMIGFCAILILVATLGIVSYIQANKIHQQTDNLYNHPQQVRRAIGALEADILKMRLSTRDLMLADDAKEKQASIELMQIAELDAIELFVTIHIHNGHTNSGLTLHHFFSYQFLCITIIKICCSG